MANYATAVLAKGQTVVSEKYQAPENRRKVPTVMELSLKNTETSITEANQLRNATTRPVDINFQTNVAAGSSTAKAYNHTGAFGDSAKINLIYVTHVETMSIPRKLADGNILAYQDIFNNLYGIKWKNLRTRHDTSALAYLMANRCQLLSAVITPQIASANPGLWSDANLALEVDANKKARFSQMAQAFMAARYLQGDFDVVADLQTAAEFQYAEQQGSGNYQNTAFQFGPTNIATTQDQISAAYPFGASLWMPKGSFVGIYWNEPLNRRGVNEPGPIGLIGTQSDPFGSGAVADISMYTLRGDTSANTTGGSTEDIIDQWEIALTIAYAAPPLSLTNDSVIHLIAQAG